MNVANIDVQDDDSHINNEDETKRNESNEEICTQMDMELLNFDSILASLTLANA